MPFLKEIIRSIINDKSDSSDKLSDGNYYTKNWEDQIEIEAKKFKEIKKETDKRE